MADKIDHVLLTIADKVRDSIERRRLHADYTEILDFCRRHHISSYALDLIIHQELEDLKKDEEDLQPHRFMMEIIPTSTSGIGEKREKNIDTGTLDKENKNLRIEEEWRKKFSRILKKAVIILWVILTMGLIFWIIYENREIRAKDQQLYQIKTAARKVTSAFNEISPSHIGDWTSSNTCHSSEDTFTIPIYVHTGDILTGEAWADSERTHDFLEVLVTKEGFTPERICKISGKDEMHEIYHKFSSGGLYSLYVRYRKDSSISHNSDRGGVRNLELDRQLNESIELVE